MSTLDRFRCVVFDFAFTLCSDLYFRVSPPGCPEWHGLFQEHIFADRLLIDRWMRGDLSTRDIASRMTQYVYFDIPTIVQFMERGCENLQINPAVWDFALAQKAQGRKTALVTLNMDIFSSVVVPSLHLDRVFDAVLNSADYQELKKEVLWSLAFQRLGPAVGFANSLLIDDSPANVKRFEELGGEAYQYSDDASFLKWAARRSSL